MSRPTVPAPFPRALAALALAALIAGLAPAQAAAQAAEPPPALVAQPMILHPAEIWEVRADRLTQTVRISGTVQPSRRAELSAQVSGLAETVHVLPGQSVTEGQVLVDIATADLQLQLEAQQASLASTRVQLQSARAALARANALSASGVASRTALDDAQSQVDVLEASLESLETQVRLAQTNLGRATIRAPFAGVIATRSVEAGQLVGAGATLVSIVDLSTVTVEAVAPLIDTLDLAVGQTAVLALPGERQGTLVAAVERINPVAEPGTRSIKFYLTLPNTDGRLRGGTFLTGHVELRVAEDALAVPRDAIRIHEGAPHVMVIQDGRVALQPVTTGASWSSGSLVQITEGLTPGQRVVAMTLRGLHPGQAVTVSED